jgi:hypothetical protein
MRYLLTVTIREHAGRPPAELQTSMTSLVDETVDVDRLFEDADGAESFAMSRALSVEVNWRHSRRVNPADATLTADVSMMKTTSEPTETFIDLLQIDLRLRQCIGSNPTFRMRCG